MRLRSEQTSFKRTKLAWLFEVNSVMITFKKIDHKRAVYITRLELELLELMDELEKHKPHPPTKLLALYKRRKNKPK